MSFNMINMLHGSLEGTFKHGLHHPLIDSEAKHDLAVFKDYKELTWSVCGKEL